MALLDEVDANAAAIGAVNTIVDRDGRLTGYNTDGLGLVRDLEEWIAIRGKTFVILGAGGAARAAVFSLLQKRRNGHRRQPDRGAGRGRWPRVSAVAGVPAEIDRLEADCLINTTPLGMFPETDRTPLKDHPRPFSVRPGYDLQPREDTAPAGGRGGGMRRPLRRRDVRPPGGGTDPSLDGDWSRRGSGCGRRSWKGWEDTVEIRPLDRLDATVRIPGSKSYTQRAMVIAALAEGESILTGPLLSEDTRILAAALTRSGRRYPDRGHRDDCPRDRREDCPSLPGDPSGEQRHGDAPPDGDSLPRRGADRPDGRPAPPGEADEAPA